MDEISLNVARRHCRSPLSSGENAGFKKGAVPRFPASPDKKNVACPAKEKMPRQMLGREGASG
jgi:hypothetical protein